MIILGYLGAILTGISLGLIGAGGSILILPVLVYLFGIEPLLATGYSLFIVGIASLAGAYNYAKKGLIEYKTALIFAVPAFIGVFSTRKFLLPAIPNAILKINSYVLTKDSLIMIVFAVVMLFASLSMIRKKTQNENKQLALSYNYKMISFEGLGVGVMTGFVGAGGGFLIIPSLVLFAKLPMKLAIGTSLIIISAKSLLGFLGDLGGPNLIDWSFLLSITLISIIGIYIGVFLSRFISGKSLRPAFGWFVLVMGIFIMITQFI